MKCNVLIRQAMPYIDTHVLHAQDLSPQNNASLWSLYVGCVSFLDLMLMQYCPHVKNSMCSRQQELWP